MNSKNASSNNEPQPIQASHFDKMQCVDFSLTYEQYLTIQHNLPKRYSLIDHKNIKRGVVITSAVKLGPEDTQNFSKLSGNVQNTEEIQGRTKRVRIKKVDKFLEQQPQKNRKPTLDIQQEDDFSLCYTILSHLKKHKSAFPFLVPVDSKLEGAHNYFDIIKQPMDLQTAQAKLDSKAYSTAAQFHADICRMWSNSYTFNEQGTVMHKYTVDMQRYYKNLLIRSKDENGFKKGPKTQKYKTKGQKERFKSQTGDMDLERKKSEYKDYIYDPVE